jgi:DNA-binding HxlR family transcriptional regulator
VTGRGRYGRDVNRSPLDAAMAKIGDRWSLLVIEALLDEPLAFSQIQSGVEGIAATVLSQRLKRLQAEDLVVAQPYQQRPVRHAYALTPAGRELASAVRLLAAWGAAHDQDVHPPQHRACGTPLETAWRCPTCEEVVTDPGTDGLRYV